MNVTIRVFRKDLMRRVDEFLEPGSRVRVENNPSINYQAKPDGQFYPKSKWCLVVIMSSVLVSTLHIQHTCMSNFKLLLQILRNFPRGFKKPNSKCNQNFMYKK